MSTKPRRPWSDGELDLLNAAALLFLERGDVRRAVELLKSGSALRQDLRDAIALHLEGGPPKKTGRPRNTLERLERDALACIFARAELAQLKAGGSVAAVDAVAALADSWGKSEKQMQHVLYPPPAVLAIVDQMQDPERPGVLSLPRHLIEPRR